MKLWVKHSAFTLLFFITSSIHAQKPIFLSHSHNDYEQEEPLTKALAHNFNSIEVDIFEYNGNIVVSHDDDDLEHKPSLKALYLNPLARYPFPAKQSIFLLIDLKMEGKSILEVLNDEISEYPQLFKSRSSNYSKAPLQIVLSGSVNKEYVLSNDEFQYFFLDGRLDDLVKEYDSKLVPLISSNIEDLYCWRPSKKVTKDKLKPLIEAIQNVHKQDKLIRFWNTPDEPNLWDLLVALNIDIIGVDDLDKFSQYASKY